MASERQNQTVADYVALVISPALIMGLVSSLVFFLLEVFYRADGEWKGRLQWVLFFFVFGAVLVARMAITDSAMKAKFYGPVLAMLTYIGLQTFVKYPEQGGLKELSFLINLILVGVVWWCANRITWDCTNIDEETEMNAEGLLQAAGLEEPENKEPPSEAEEGETATAKKTLNWWERWQKYREQRNKKRTLGVWVVYFSLAALPLFGIGQALIPLTAPERRQFTFWLMTVYVACGLGLLMTTCFLSLRRYLRQRRLQMPAAMTGTWLTFGGGLVLTLLLLGAFLPRPYPEYPLFDILTGRSSKRKASQYARKGGPHGEGKGNPGEARRDGKQPGDATGKDGKGKGADQKDGKVAGQDQKDGSGKSKQGKDGQGEKGEKGKDSSGGKKDGERGEKEGKGSKSDSSQKGKEGQKDGSSSSSSPSGKALQRLSQVTSRIAPVLKWIVFAVLIVVVLFFVLRGGLQFLANFTDWARRLLEAWRNFWANLFGGRARKDEGPQGEAGEEAEEQGERALPFSAFPNPFETGAARRWSAQELVRYTFAAFGAWARERDLGRLSGETAQEFAERVGEEVPALEAPARRLAGLYARAVYAPGGMPANTAEVVRQFWDKLEAVVAQPLSA
jgi:hypothetical protein